MIKGTKNERKEIPSLTMECGRELYIDRWHLSSVSIISTGNLETKRYKKTYKEMRMSPL
jgi:Zn-dependent M16 (insulinase) family peptidase